MGQVSQYKLELPHTWAVWTIFSVNLPHVTNTDNQIDYKTCRVIYVVRPNSPKAICSLYLVILKAVAIRVLKAHLNLENLLVNSILRSGLRAGTGSKQTGLMFCEPSISFFWTSADDSYFLCEYINYLLTSQMRFFAYSDILYPSFLPMCSHINQRRKPSTNNFVLQSLCSPFDDFH